MTRGLILAAVLLVAAPALADPPPDVADMSRRIADRPGDVELILQRAEIYRRQGLYRQAMVDLAQVEGLRPSEPRVVLQRALVEFDRGRHERAVQQADAYLPMAGDSFSVLSVRARSLVELGRLDAAVADYDRALSLRDDVELHLQRSRVLTRLGRADLAIQGLQEGVQATQAVVLRDALIELLVEQGRHADALSHVDSILSSARVKTSWLLRRAELLNSLGRATEATRARQQALQEAERLMSRRPSAMALTSRGEVLLAIGRRDDAVADLTRAVQLAPRLTRARRLLFDARSGGAR